MDTPAFSKEFLDDSMHQTRWNSFLKKKKAMIQVSMNDAMTRIKTFVTPLLTQISAVGGKMILPPHGKQIFTRHSKEFFTYHGKEFFT